MGAVAQGKQGERALSTAFIICAAHPELWRQDMHLASVWLRWHI